MSFRAVIFDLFGTLINSFAWDYSNDVLRRMASVLSVPADDFVAAWHDTSDYRMTGAFKNYQACIRHICREHGLKPPDEKVELAAGIRYKMNMREVTAPRGGAIEVLSRLRADGYKTGLISDCSTETTVAWEQSPLSPLFDAVVFSCKAGIKKPDPRIYHLAVDKLGVIPQECIYVADGIGQELASADELGMLAVQISIPDEDNYDPYREEWNGQVISSLREVLTLLKE